jgi:hypothetical protein
MINITKIYLVTNIDNNPLKVYIGKTKNSTRERDHKHKYGHNIIFNIIDEIQSIEKLDWEPLETYWIEQFKQWGFEVVNKNQGGGGPGFHTEISRSKISSSKLGQKYSPNHGIKISKALTGKSKSKEHCLNISLSKKGVPNLKNTIPKPKGFGEVNFKPILQYSLNREFIKEWKSLKEAAIFLGYKKSPSSMSLNLTGKYKSALGFIWEYKLK